MNNTRMTIWGVGPPWIVRSVLWALPIVYCSRISGGVLPLGAVMPRTTAVIGAILLVLGFLFCAAGAQAVRRHFAQGTLCTSGVFSLCRNPIYGAWILFIIPGFVLLIKGDLFLLLIPVAMYICLGQLLPQEEAWLRDRFGRAYNDYLRSVPRIVPRLRRREASSRRRTQGTELRENLTGIPATMLITLWAKAVETKRENPILTDHRAAQMVDAIDYDFSVFDSCWKSQVGVAIRSMIFDRETKNFLRRHPDGIVVSLGSGLDFRQERIDALDVRWYDLDLPEAIEVRSRYLPETEHRRYLARSVFDVSWMDDIPKDAPVLFIAEGLLMYFTEGEVRSLFVDLARRFPGGEMLYEILGSALVGKARFHDSLPRVSPGLEFLWGPKDPAQVVNWSRHIHFLEKWNIFDYALPRWRWMRLFGKIRWLRENMSNHVVHVVFDNDKRGA